MERSSATVHPVIQEYIDQFQKVPDLTDYNVRAPISENFWKNHPEDWDPVIRKFYPKHDGRIPHLEKPLDYWDISTELPSETWLDTICYYAASYFSWMPWIGTAAYEYCRARGSKFLFNDVNRLVKDLDVAGIQRDISVKLARIEARKIMGYDPEEYTRSEKEQVLFDAIEERGELKEILSKKENRAYVSCIRGTTDEYDRDALSYKIELFDAMSKYKTSDGEKDRDLLLEGEWRLELRLGHITPEGTKVLKALKAKTADL